MTRKASRHSRRIIVNPIAFAIEGAGKLHPEQKAGAIAIIDRAWADLQAGENVPEAWADLATMANVAEELCARGICSDDASVYKVAACQEALAILARHPDANPWGWEALVRDGIWVAKTQLDFVSVREFEAAAATVREKTRQAKAGNVGAGTTVVAMVK